MCVDRTDVGDAARTLGGDQASRRFLRDQPAAIEIGLHHRRTVVVGVVEHAPGCGHTGVVDDEMERTEFVAGLTNCGDDTGTTAATTLDPDGRAAPRRDLVHLKYGGPSCT